MKTLIFILIACGIFAIPYAIILTLKNQPAPKEVPRHQWPKDKFGKPYHPLYRHPND
jgi:hypothetical protein